MIDRLNPPAIHDAVNFNYTLSDCNQQICQNNIPIYWLNAGSQEVIQIDWVFKSGLWNESKTAVAAATAGLLKNGTATKNAFEINDAIEFYGASLRVSINNDFGFVTLHTLTRHLPKLLPIIKEVILEPTFPEAELEVYIKNSLQRLNINLMKGDFIANRNIDAMLFGKQHPYGRYTEREDIQALTVADLKQHHQQFYTSSDCTIFMAGNMSQNEVDLIAQYFGSESWNDANSNLNIIHDLQPSTEKYKRIVNDEKSVQGAVRLARSCISRGHPDFAPLIVLNTLFGGYFGSRLMANIREEKGYTYGIYSQLYPTQKAGALLIATEAGHQVCEATVEEVFKEMKLLREVPVSEDELLLVKNYLLGNLLGDLDGPFSIMQRWKNLVLNQLTTSYFDKNIEVYKSIKPQQLHELANQYFKEEDFYNLIVY